MSVNTGLQIDITAGILFISVSTDIFYIPNGMLVANRMIWMQQEIRTNCLTLSSMKFLQIHKNRF
jgi:propanediol utilization protein